MTKDGNVIIKLRNELIRSAKNRKHLEYLTASWVIGLEEEDRNSVNDVLYEISISEHKDGKPILWPIIERTQSLDSRYFEMLLELDLITNEDDKQEVYERQIAEAFSYWSKRRKTGRSGSKG